MGLADSAFLTSSLMGGGTSTSALLDLPKRLRLLSSESASIASSSSEPPSSIPLPEFLARSPCLEDALDWILRK